VSAALDLRVIGCGDAFGSGGRAHAAFLLEADAGRVLLDCGASTLPALRRWGVRPASIDAVIVSHFHGDHFGGVPFLILDRRYREPAGRPLLIAGPERVEARIATLARALYGGGAASPAAGIAAFLELQPERRVPVGPAQVEAFRVPHQPDEFCLGFRVEMGGKSVVYSGDTEWFDGLASRSEGADLLLLECTHAVAGGGHHVGLDQIVANRERLGCRRLLLTHLGDEARIRCPAAGLACAEDGMRVSL
jgi:ribonuclease BN (tRNA processing enzyme)